MHPLIPATDSIPVAWGYLQFLLLLTFALHLLLMNCLVGSTAMAFFGHLRRDDAGHRLAGELAKILPLLVALTVNFGVAPLLFSQVLYGQFLYVSSILIGVFWLAVVPMLIVAYGSCYIYDFGFSKLRRKGLVFLGLAFVIFLCIGFVYSNNMTLMLTPTRWAAYFKDSAGTLLNLGEPSLFPRYLHFIIGGIGIGGLFVWSLGRVKTSWDDDVRNLAMGWGRKWFLSATIVSMLFGIVFLFVLPKDVVKLFMGGNQLASATFGVSLLLSLLVVWTAWTWRLRLTLIITVPLVYLMSFLRAYVRYGFLKTDFTFDMLKVFPQYEPMYVFFGTLVIGLLTIGWMIWAVRKRTWIN